MPNIKISQLPFANIPENDALLPIVQFGITYRTSLQQILDAYLIPELAADFQPISFKTQTIFADGGSLTKYPSAKAVKDYADSLVIGLLDDRGNFTPDAVSPGDYPQNGGSGPGGTIAKGDLWFIDAVGFLGTQPVVAGQSVRALVNNADVNNDADWNILDVAGFTQAPEASANKVISKADFISNGSSIIKYPSVKAVKDYIDEEVTLQDVLNNGSNLTNNLNLQGGAGGGMGLGVTDVNAFGNGAADTNIGSNLNAFGQAAGQDNLGNHLNAMGYAAGANQSGDYVEAIGFQAANTSTGNDVVAIGRAAAFGQDGSSVVALGRNAAADNQGGNVVAIGEDAAKDNTGIESNIIGYGAGDSNGGDEINAFGKNAGVGNTFNNVNLFGTGASANANGQTVFSNGTNQLRIDTSSLASDVQYSAPASSGTLVLSVNGNAPSPSGDVTLSIPNAGLPYLMYAAFLQFSSGSITATQLYNTIGDGSGDGIDDIAWSYGVQGYDATMSSAPFTTKSAVVPGGYYGNATVYSITGSRISSSTMRLIGARTSDNSIATAFVANVYVEIRIYP